MQIQLPRKTQQKFLAVYKQSLEQDTRRRYSAIRQLMNLAYANRSSGISVRKFAECVGWMWIQEYEKQKLYLLTPLFPEKSFAQFASLLTENGKRDEAITLCRKAAQWNVSDGTHGGFVARIQRLGAGTPSEIIKLDLDIGDSQLYITNFITELRQLYKTTAQVSGVPILDGYWVHMKSKDLLPAQSTFYKNWCKSWRRGEYISTDGQEAYVMIYISENLVTSKKAISYDRVDELLALRSSAERLEPDNKTIVYFCGRFAADSLIYLGEYSRACDVFPQMPLNDFLSLRYAEGKALNGDDLVRAFGISSLTDFGQQNLDRVVDSSQSVLNEYQRERGKDILSYWASHIDLSEMRLFRSLGYYPMRQLREFRFQESEILDDFKGEVSEILREAENLVRDKMGVPRIGEGWVSETELFYRVKNAFPKFEIIHHASPSWLGRQHLDIYISELDIAIEYQGIQHRKPVEFFGGIEGLKATQERDARKKILCQANNVTLIEIESGYDFEQLIKQIKAVVD